MWPFCLAFFCWQFLVAKSIFWPGESGWQKNCGCFWWLLRKNTFLGEGWFVFLGEMSESGRVVWGKGIFREGFLGRVNCEKITSWGEDLFLRISKNLSNLRWKKEQHRFWIIIWCGFWVGPFQKTSRNWDFEGPDHAPWKTISPMVLKYVASLEHQRETGKKCRLQVNLFTPWRFNI